MSDILHTSVDNTRVPDPQYRRTREQRSHRSHRKHRFRPRIASNASIACIATIASPVTSIQSLAVSQHGLRQSQGSDLTLTLILAVELNSLESVRVSQCLSDAALLC